MRNIILSLLCAGIFIGVCAGSAAAQTPVLTGGYSRAATGDAEVSAAARFAAKKQAAKSGTMIRILTIDRAERQVVAGTNYRLCLTARVAARGRKASARQFSAVVYKNLRGVSALTSWKEERCGADN